MAGQFVGRVAELATIAREIDAAMHGSTHVVLVGGDPGQGKTGLLEEASAGVTATRLWVRGYELERNVPFAAASELLSSLRSDGSAPLDGLLTGDTVPGNLGVEPLRLFEAVHLGLADRVPVLFLVDDLQWLDELSLAMVHYLIRSAAAAGEAVTFVVAGRPSSQLQKLAEAARSFRGGTVAAIDLGPLEPAEGISLVMSLAPATDRRRAAEIHERAGGYPFWIRTLVADEAMPAGEGPRADTATGADAATGAATATPGGGPTRLRLQGVTADGARLVALLTVLATPSTAAELAALLEWTEARMVTALMELEARAIVVDRAGSIRLTHDLVRAAAEREIPDDMLRALHGRVAETIEADAGDDVQRLRSALDHRRRAGLSTLALATRLARTTGRRWLGTAGLHELDEIAWQEDPDRVRAPDLWVAIASLATELGDHRLALDRWIALAAGDRRQRAHALVEAARAAFALDLPSEASGYLTKAKAAAPDAATSIRIQAVTTEIEIWADRRSGSARRHANQAVAAARRLAARAGGVDGLEPESRRAYVEALQPAYETALQTDDHAAIERLAEEALEVAGGFDDAAYLQALVWSALAARQLARLGDAATRSRRALQEAEQRVMPHAAIDAGRTLAATLLDLGRLDEAEAIAAEAEALAGRVGEGDRVGRRMKYILYQIRLSTGDRQATIAASSRAAREEGVAHFALAFHQMLATWLARMSGPVAAADVSARVGDARRLAAEAGCARCAAEVELASAEALLRIGEVDLARGALSEWDAARPDPSPAMGFWRSWVQALLATEEAGARDPSVIGRIDDLLAGARQRGRRMDELWLLLDRARVAGTDRRRAAASFREAAELADDLGALAELRLAELGLRGLGVRTWRRGPSVKGASGLGSLTPRELEVARLVAGGSSNPEIAAALYLSRKTVERHVSNVLMKFAARNRTELAARMAEADTARVEGTPR